MTKSIIILSGGLDSTTLLYDRSNCGLICSERSPDYEGKPSLAISFYYGQKHSKELDCAKWHAANLEIPWKVIELVEIFGEMKSSALISKELGVPTIESVQGLPQPITYVPNRNLIFLSIATGVAEDVEADVVYYGAQKHDLYSYWDTSDLFLKRLNHLLALNRKKPIEIKAPYVNYSKADILRSGIELGVDYSKTWSCYSGGERICKTCPTCAERLKAFRDIGKKDPLDWE